MIADAAGDVLPKKPPLALMLTADRQIDRRITLEADALEEDGWRVVILAMQTDNVESHPDRRVVRLGISPRKHGREFLILQLYRRARSMMAMNSFLMRRLKAIAWTYLVDQEKFYVDLFLGEALLYPASLVVAHDLPMLPVAARVANTMNAKLAYDSHELFAEQEFGEREKRRWRAIEDSYIRGADRVVTVNQSIAEELQQRYSLTDVRVILNAERPYALSHSNTVGLKRRLGMDEKSIIGLFQGGLSAGRNLKTLVQAMCNVSASEMHLVFLGDGQMAGPLAAEATRLGVAHRIHFLRAVPQAELLDLTASADFGIIPYQPNCLNTYYCTPNKLFEFIAANIPIVASDLPELRRFVAGNGIGLIGDFSKAENVAALLSAMAIDDERRQLFKSRLAEVRQTISWEVEGRKFSTAMSDLKPDWSLC